MNKLVIEYSKLNFEELKENSLKNLQWCGEINDFISAIEKDSEFSYSGCEVKCTGSELNYLAENKENAIFIPFAIDDTLGNLLMANGNLIEMDEIDLGSIDVYEDTIIGLVVMKDGDNLIFDIAEFNACVGRYDIVKYPGDLAFIIEDFLKKYIK